MKKNLSIYIHVPFCAGKCPYCDFYSLPAATQEAMDAYVERLVNLVAQIHPKSRAYLAETVYFGGGTPSLLGARRLASVLEAVIENFSVSQNLEVTCEANPTHVDRRFFRDLRQAGFNRLSMGLQSAVREELALLGRAHTPEDAARAVEWGRAGGFENISLDLMLGLPGGTEEKLGRSIAFGSELGAKHISAYILKVEPNTPFAQRSLALPDGDQVAEQYLFCVRELAARGYGQYEISNFTQPGFTGRHNMNYWLCGEYLGLGPGAHSFIEERRSYYPRDLAGFLAGDGTIDDGPGGGLEEFAMLRLRLTQGLTRGALAERFGTEGEAAFEKLQANASHCPPDLLAEEEGRVALSPEGFLVSNVLLARLLEGIA